MSKDVAVTGIQLTATTPELVEISFGKVSGTGTSAALQAPANTPDAAEWVHSAATGSVYSQFGKISPASSTDGNTLFYAKNPINYGKAVKDEANPFTEIAANGTDCVEVAYVGSGITLESTDSDTNPTANDDNIGYYLDIPVWFRTTKTDDINLGVKATINYATELKDTEDNVINELYKAARVSILTATNQDNADNIENNGSVGVIKLAEATYYDNTAVKTAGASLTASYDTPTIVTQYNDTAGADNSGATTVATVNANAVNNGYSTPTKYIIRVWLEGEDTACWNKNASQDFYINLNFYDLS